MWLSSCPAGRCTMKRRTGLKTVSLPNGLEAIPDGLFFGCVFDIFEIPDTVTRIGRNAFGYCWEITEIAIPDSVQSIGERAFSEYANLSLTVAEGSYAAQYAEENGIPFLYGME